MQFKTRFILILDQILTAADPFERVASLAFLATGSLAFSSIRAKFFGAFAPPVIKTAVCFTDSPFAERYELNNLFNLSQMKFSQNKTWCLELFTSLKMESD